MEDNFSAIFKALGHPIRRGIIDLLRDAPRTTGQLDDQFPQVSRYSIMKHLNILQEGNLVLVRREGKYKRHFLNAVPLQEVHDRWVGKYMGNAASSLLNLKSISENEGGNSEMSTSNTFKIEKEILIQAPREKVFKALTERIDEWWEFRIAPEGTPSALSFNPVPGGQLVEKWGEGQGAVWGNVYYLHAPEEMRLYGHLGMQGAVNSAYTYRLLEREGATLLQLSHHASGIIDEEWEQQHREGWDYLLGTCLKNFLEKE